MQVHKNTFLHQILMILLATLALLTILSSIFFGIEFTDTGFILGLSHRIHMGQHIYTDFDYVRPPITPWLWHLPLLIDIEAKEVLLRSFVVLQKFLTGLLIYFTLRRFEVSLSVAFLGGATTFIFLTHHIPMMPWHTTDGIFFSVLAIYLFSANLSVLGFLVALITALTKQSFYPFPLLYFFLALIIFPSKRIWMFILLPIFMVANYFIYDVYGFLDQSSSSTGIRDLVDSAVVPLVPRSVIVMVFYFVLFVAWKLRGKFGEQHLTSVVICFPLFVLFAITIRAYFMEAHPVFSVGPYGITQVFMVVTLFHLAHRFWVLRFRFFKSRETGVAIMLLGSAWMSSISWGYANFMFAYGLILAANLVLLGQYFRCSSNYATSLGLVAFCVFFALRIITPYRMENPFFEQYQMVQSGHYKYIFAEKSAVAKLQSINKISKISGCKDTYPSVPQAALLGGYIPPMRADWKMNIEYPNHHGIQQQLVKANCKLFVEKDKRVLGWTGRFRSSMLDLEKFKTCTFNFDDYFDVVDFSKCVDLADNNSVQ